MSSGNLPGWMSPKKARQNINKRSAKQERKRAGEINGRVQAGSGSSWRAPQDVRGQVPLAGGAEDSEEVLEQLKFTDAAGWRITAAELESLLADALRSGREARYIIEFPRRGIRLVGRVERTPNR